MLRVDSARDQWYHWYYDGPLCEVRTRRVYQFAMSNGYTTTTTHGFGWKTGLFQQIIQRSLILDHSHIFCKPCWRNVRELYDPQPQPARPSQFKGHMKKRYGQQLSRCFSRVFGGARRLLQHRICTGSSSSFLLWALGSRGLSVTTPSIVHSHLLLHLTSRLASLLKKREPSGWIID